MDWCKMIQSIESALDVREGLVVLRARAEAAGVVEGGMLDGTCGHHMFLARLVGKLTSIRHHSCVARSLEGVHARTSNKR